MLYSWSANKVIGKPQVYPNYGDIEGSWAQGNISANEYIEVSVKVLISLYFVSVGLPIA